MEEMLRQSEANVRAMLNSTHHSFTLIDANGIVIDADDAGKAASLGIFGREIAPGAVIQDFVLERDRASFERNFNRTLDGETVTTVKRFQGKDRDYIYEVRYYPVTDRAGQVIGVCMSNEDITQRTRVEMQLRESESQYRLLANNVSDMISKHTPSGNYTFMTPAIETLLGYTPDEVIGRSGYDFFHPMDLPRIGDSHRDLLETGESQPVIYRIRHKDGHYIWVETSLQLRVDPQSGEPLEITAVSRDVTDRKRTEDYLRAVLDSSLSGIMAFEAIRNEDKRIIDFEWRMVNQQAEHIIGRHMDQLIGRRLLEEMPGNPNDTLFQQYVQVVETGQPLDQEYHHDHNGTDVWFHITAVKLDDGLVVTVEDVSRRKKAERDLRQSEMRLRSILEVDTAFITRTDINGFFTYANSALWDRYRWQYPNRDDMLGEFSLDTIMPEDHEKAFNTVQVCLLEPGRSFQVTLRKPTQDGGFFHALWEFVAITDDDGRPQEIQCIGFDITDQVEAREQEFRLKLEQERRQVLTDFIRNAAHEFRTPLSTISTSCYLIAHNKDPEQRIAKLPRIQSQVDRMTHLVDMLLKMSQIETINPADFLPVSLTLLIQQIYDAYTFREHPIRLVLEMPDDLPSVTGDARWLADAINALLENARKHSPDGEQIHLRAFNTSGYVCIQVADEGAGIPPEHLPHIFETFWRGDAAHSTPGLGLGLPMAQKIITIHGGQLDVESTIAVGTTFTIRLPLG